MRYLLYIAVLLALIVVPAERMDVARLLPVEVIRVTQEAESVRIETDTGHTGVGKDLEEAYRNMETSAEGVIYPDTAEYLLMTNPDEMLLTQLRAYLKSSVCICKAEGEIDLQEASEYLDVHDAGYTLGQTETVERMQTLRRNPNGFVLE